MKRRKVVEHLPKSKSGKFAKIITFFLKATISTCEVKITGKPVNLGENMQVPYTLKIPGDPTMVKKLQSLLQKFDE